MGPRSPRRVLIRGHEKRKSFHAVALGPRWCAAAFEWNGRKNSLIDARKNNERIARIFFITCGNCAPALWQKTLARALAEPEAHKYCLDDCVPRPSPMFWQSRAPARKKRTHLLHLTCFSNSTQIIDSRFVSGNGPDRKAKSEKQRVAADGLFLKPFPQTSYGLYHRRFTAICLTTATPNSTMFRSQWRS